MLGGVRCGFYGVVSMVRLGLVWYGLVWSGRVWLGGVR